MKEHLTIRFGEESDQKYLVEWLLQPGVLEGFPLNDLREIEDAARIWVSYSKYNAVLTALWDGVPCGIANLYLQPYKKMSHQCLFAIIVDEKYRGKGIGDVALTHPRSASAPSRQGASFTAVFEAVAKKAGCAVGAVRLVYEGAPIAPSATALQLRMDEVLEDLDDGDTAQVQVDCVQS